MDNEAKVRFLVREMLESFFDEERIANPDAAEHVKRRENFIGSHTYGEDLGGYGLMYVAYSYGEQHPVFVWVDKEEFKKMRPHEKGYVGAISTGTSEEDDSRGIWFYNDEPYYVLDKRTGKKKINKWTQKHKRDLKPTEKLQKRGDRYIKRLIHDFKARHKLADNSHTNLEPGEK